MLIHELSPRKICAVPLAELGDRHLKEQQETEKGSGLEMF